MLVSTTMIVYLFRAVAPIWSVERAAITTIAVVATTAVVESAAVQTVPTAMIVRTTSRLGAS